MKERGREIRKKGKGNESARKEKRVRKEEELMTGKRREGKWIVEEEGELRDEDSEGKGRVTDESDNLARLREER